MGIQWRSNEASPIGLESIGNILLNDEWPSRKKEEDISLSVTCILFSIHEGMGQISSKVWGLIIAHKSLQQALVLKNVDKSWYSSFISVFNEIAWIWWQEKNCQMSITEIWGDVSRLKGRLQAKHTSYSGKQSKKFRKKGGWGTNIIGVKLCLCVLKADPITRDDATPIETGWVIFDNEVTSKGTF